MVWTARTRSIPTEKPSPAATASDPPASGKVKLRERVKLGLQGKYENRCGTGTRNAEGTDGNCRS